MADAEGERKWNSTLISLGPFPVHHVSIQYVLFPRYELGGGGIQILE